MSVLVGHESVGDSFRLNRRENDMARIGNNHGSRPATVGGIDQLTPIAGIGNDTLDRGGLRTDNGNDSVGGNNIAKTDVDKLYLLSVHDEHAV